MSRPSKLSLKKLEMPSPYIPGIRPRKDNQVFPASPTILEVLHVDKDIVDEWLQKRQALILAKQETAYTYDKRLRPYQNADVNFLMKFSKGKGVFNQQRVGKTPVTLVTMREKGQNNNIIIVPKSTIHQWIHEYKKWHGGPVIEMKESWLRVRKKRVQVYKENQGTLITNYEKIRTDLDPILEHLGPFDSVVLDEAHMMRNYKGTSEKASSPRNTKAIMKIRKHSKDAYALSGTPTPNKEADICGILAFLFPELFQFYWPVIDYYFTKTQEKNLMTFKNYYKVKSFQNKYKKQELLEFLETFSIQRKRKDVMKWLPKVDTEIVTLDPTQKQLQWHNELKQYFETEHVICENALTTMIALRQIACDPKVLGLESRNPKFEWIRNHIEDYPDKPMLIVSSFSRVLKNLKEYLKKYEPRLMYGDTSSSERERQKDDFQKRKYNILLGNIQVVKEGLTLSKAEEIIFLDPSLTYTDNEQAADRFLPISEKEAIEKEGQKIIKLIYRKTIDIYINRSLNKKRLKTDIINNYTKHLKGGDKGDSRVL